MMGADAAVSIEVENLATRAAVRDLVASVQRLDPAHRHLLQQAFEQGRALAADVNQPGLARVNESLRALVLQLRQAWGDTNG